MPDRLFVNTAEGGNVCSIMRDQIKTVMPGKSNV
jgi:hypothetical protein